MQQDPAKITEDTIRYITENNKKYVKSCIELATKLRIDPDNKKRIKDQECKTCFYATRISQHAVSSRPCAFCTVKMTFGSTNTDVACVSCAKEHLICKHCGGDIEDKSRHRRLKD